MRKTVRSYYLCREHVVGENMGDLFAEDHFLAQGMKKVVSCV